MANFFGADKVLRLLGWVQKNGGIVATLKKGFRYVFNYAMKISQSSIKQKFIY